MAVAIPGGGRSISQVNNSFVPIPPPPPPRVLQPPTGPPPTNNDVPSAIQVPQGSAGSAFGRRNTNDNDDQASVVSRVTIDGRTYVSGPVYDANGNQIS